MLALPLDHLPKGGVMNMMSRATNLRNVSFRMSKRSSPMPKGQQVEFRKLVECARNRLVRAGTWELEVEAREEVSARVREALADA